MECTTSVFADPEEGKAAVDAALRNEIRASLSRLSRVLAACGAGTATVADGLTATRTPLARDGESESKLVTCTCTGTCGSAGADNNAAPSSASSLPSSNPDAIPGSSWRSLASEPVVGLPADEKADLARVFAGADAALNDGLKGRADLLVMWEEFNTKVSARFRGTPAIDAVIRAGYQVSKTADACGSHCSWADAWWASAVLFDLFWDAVPAHHLKLCCTGAMKESADGVALWHALENAFRGGKEEHGGAERFAIAFRRMRNLAAPGAVTSVASIPSHCAAVCRAVDAFRQTFASANEELREKVVLYILIENLGSGFKSLDDIVSRSPQSHSGQGGASTREISMASASSSARTP